MRLDFPAPKDTVVSNGVVSNGVISNGVISNGQSVFALVHACLTCCFCD
ncbi:MAG: hypothetical protein AAFQ96_07175 [Pseudomonadota bacterium]